MTTKKRTDTSKKERAADLRMRREYHITLEEYNKVAKHQKGVCAMCKLPVPPGKTKLAIDHRHSDGLLRGLLCWKCNRAIGAFQRYHPEAIELFRSAFEYLQNPTFSIVFREDRYTVPGKVGTKKRAKLLLAMKANGVK